MQEIRFFVVAFLLCWKCGRCTTQRPETIHRATKPPYIPSLKEGALGGRLVIEATQTLKSYDSSLHDMDQEQERLTQTFEKDKQRLTELLEKQQQ